MRNGYVFAIYRVCGAITHLVRREMGYDLVTVEVEVDPMVGASSLATAEQPPVEATRGGEIVDWKG